MTSHAQTRLLPQTATALGATIDAMFRHSAKRTPARHEGDNRPRRRLLAVGKLDVAGKRRVLQVLHGTDTFMERGQLKPKVGSRA